MVNYNIEAYQVGMVGTNCYLLINKETNDALIVDPGDEAAKLQQKIDNAGVRPVAILLTHGHFDHVMAAAELAANYGIERYVHELDMDTLKDPRMNVSPMIGAAKVFEADRTVKDGDRLELAGFKIKVLHTPGHTPGGVCYYIEDEKVLFSGDSLFCGSIGRTDFPGGSSSQLIRGIKEKLMILPEEVGVYPGHDSVTTIGDEKRYNPYL